MSVNFAPQKLPKKRTGNYLNWIEKQSIAGLILKGILAYFLVAMAFTSIELIFALYNFHWVMEKNNPIVSFLDLLYFNFITILTVGYGDYQPVSFGRVLSVLEAFIGVGVFTIFIALVTTKLLLPARNTIVFSKYAYYCELTQRFLIIFVNTSRTNLVNAEINSYFKLRGDWIVKPSVVAPFITQSVQTFYLESVDNEKLKSYLEKGDCLRVGIAGDVGFTRFSTSIEYSLNQIIIIENRDILTEYDGFHNPDFSNLSDDFYTMFHYYPPNSQTIEKYLS